MTPLVSLEDARARLFALLTPARPSDVEAARAIGATLAQDAMAPADAPARPYALQDGYAVSSSQIAGASPYAPAPLRAMPPFIEAGETPPPDTDAIVDASLIERLGPLAQAVGEATPGEGLRRIGEDCRAGAVLAPAGARWTALHARAAIACGLERVAIRRARLRIVAVPARGESGQADTSAALLVAWARALGASAALIAAPSREAAAIAACLRSAATDADLVVLLGGSGLGPSDAAAAALAQAGDCLLHGVAIEPGRSLAIARVAAAPVILAPRRADALLAAWLAMIAPALEQISGARPPPPLAAAPLARKIASMVGISQLVLLARAEDAWLPLSIGDAS